MNVVESNVFIYNIWFCTHTHTLKMFRRSINIFRRGFTSFNSVRLDSFHTHQFVNHIEAHNRNILKTLVTDDGSLIRYVSAQTEELAFEAVRHRGLNLFYVREPLKTVDLCECGVDNDPWALEYVNEIFQTVPMCISAVSRDWRTIIFVKNQTAVICECAVRGNWYALAHVKNKTDRLCILALRQDLRAMRFIDGGTIRKIRLYLLSRIR